jgi:hypothetical protein
MSTTGVVSVELTEDELRLVRNALQSFIADFGHDESDVRRAAQRVLAKLNARSA